MDEQEDRRRRRRGIEFAGISAALMTLLFIIIGQSAAQLTASAGFGGETSDKVKVQFSAMDYSSTGSVAKPPVVIGPCSTSQP